MNKTVSLFLTTVLLMGCSSASIKKRNIHLNQLIAVNDLKADVDYTYNKIKQLHPDLYRYISKNELDLKFDSLKTTIRKPINSASFYKIVSPTVAAIRQGHTYVFAPTKILDKKESEALIKKGTGPFSQFEFGLFNDKIYVIRNKSDNPTIKTGSEVVAVNGVKPIDLINEHNRYYSSDGYNNTFKTAKNGGRFSNFFFHDYGYKDTIQYDFKINDSIKRITTVRNNKDTSGTKTKKIVPEKIVVDRLIAKASKHRKRISGYNKSENIYNRNLRFIQKDSSVALMKINSFRLGNYTTFYKESFTKIEQYKTNTLILDLRNNGGGALSEIEKLYSYLSDSSYVFLDKSEVVSRSSLFKAGYFSGGSIAKKAIKAVFAPLVYGYLLLSVHKNENGKIYIANQSKLRKTNKKAFKGKLYVLINGGSFSASCIISSNLKGSKRATFVGEETGGAFNGTVAGFMPLKKLPNSKIQIRIGTMSIAPHFKTDIEGHGIYPDVAIQPTLEDAINGNDPELNWVLEDIKSKYNPILNK
jgi:C-terminal processing protease CtpA/Prc